MTAEGHCGDPLRKPGWSSEVATCQLQIPLFGARVECVGLEIGLKQEQLREASSRLLLPVFWECGGPSSWSCENRSLRGVEAGSVYWADFGVNTVRPCDDDASSVGIM